jgi:hypothetical protein
VSSLGEAVRVELLQEDGSSLLVTVLILWDC